MGKKIRSISKIISEDGILVFFSKVLRYFRKNIFSVTKVFIYELDLNDSIPKFSSELKLSYRFATKEDIDLMNYENYNYDEKAKKYAEERLKKGDSCVLALNNSRIIGYVWIIYDNLEISKMNFISLSKNRASTYNSFVLKEFRGKKVRNLMDNYIYEMLRKAGKRYLVCVIEKDNIASQKTRERAGYKKIWHINEFRFFGLRYDYIDKNLLSYLQKS